LIPKNLTCLYDDRQYAEPPCLFWGLNVWKPTGRHFGGPTWELNDGSQITGKMAAKADAPDPKAIPWLLVTVTGHSGSGKLSGVTSIQRVNTIGGLAPAAAECTSQSREVEFKSSYSADYYFYARR
jgi:hypothetical protein